MILSTRNFEFALQLQSIKTTSFRYVRHLMRLYIYAFCNVKIHFYLLGPLKLIQTMLKSVHILLGLSPIWNRYPKGSHTTGATKRSKIVLR